MSMCLCLYNGVRWFVFFFLLNGGGECRSSFLSINAFDLLSYCNLYLTYIILTYSSNLIIILYILLI